MAETIGQPAGSTDGAAQPAAAPPGGGPLAGGNVFSSDRFLAALNRTWFGGRGSPCDVEVGGHLLRTLLVDGEPILDVTFLDFFVPIAGDGARVRGRYAPRVATGSHPADRRDDIDPLVVEPAPWIDWRAFGSWDDVEAHWRSSEKRIVAESRRRAKHLERDLGPLRYDLANRRTEAFDACIAWKSEQFRASGLPDPFVNPREERLLRALVDDGIAVVSSLHAGDRLIAAHIGLDACGALHWWLPTYDRSLSNRAPGRLLLHWVLRQCYVRGDASFDFLRGDGAYKWVYATDFRTVEEAGHRPLARRLHLLRRRTARRHPTAAAAARRVRAVARPRSGRRRPPP
jgi:hypothetical protein